MSTPDCVVATLQHSDQGSWPGGHTFDGSLCWCQPRIAYRRGGQLPESAPNKEQISSAVEALRKRLANKARP